LKKVVLRQPLDLLLFWFYKHGLGLEVGEDNVICVFINITITYGVILQREQICNNKADRMLLAINERLIDSMTDKAAYRVYAAKNGLNKRQA